MEIVDKKQHNLVFCTKAGNKAVFWDRNIGPTSTNNVPAYGPRQSPTNQNQHILRPVEQGVHVVIAEGKI